MPRGERQPKTKCPYCQHWDSLVKGPGDPLNTGGYRRYRRCVKCLKRYTTTERADPPKPSARNI